MVELRAYRLILLNPITATSKGGEESLAKGSVYKRSGTWYAVYAIGGKRKWERGGTTKADAQRILAKRLTEIHSGSFRESARVRFVDFAARWLLEYASINVKQSTYDSYAVIFRLHLIPHFGNQWIHQITSADVQTFLARKIREETLSPKSVSNILVPLKRMFHHAVVWGMVTMDPTAHVQKPRVEMHEMDYLTPPEVNAFLGSVRKHVHTLFLTAVLTGMRRGELLALKWSDVDWQRSEIIVQRSLYRGRFVSPKTKNSRRRIVITPTLSNALEFHRITCIPSPHDLIFSNEKGQPLDPDNLVRREFLPALERAGFRNRRLRFHDLRHTYASLLIAQGESVKFVQSQLGHTSAKTTLDRYAHLMPNSNADAARRLDETVFGLSNGSVRKPLENGPETAISPQMTNPRSVSTSGS